MDKLETESFEKLFFNECFVDINLKTGYVETVFEDKTSVPMAPQPNPLSLFYSLDLGYGTDVKLMIIHNQVLHTFLMEHLGFVSSPTLWAIAHQKEYENEYWERAVVLSFQKFMNNREPDPIIRDNLDDLKKIRREAKRLLEFTYLD